MRITYDPEANAVYIQLRQGRGVDSVDLEEGVTAALDENGEVLGLEVLDARERLGRNPLAVSLEVLRTDEPAARSRPGGAKKRRTG